MQLSEKAETEVLAYTADASRTKANILNASATILEDCFAAGSSPDNYAAALFDLRGLAAEWETLAESCDAVLAGGGDRG